jgi:hypothetical protein
MSVILARHPTESSWVSFTRHAPGAYDAYSIQTGPLRQVVASSFQNLTGTWTFTERSADAAKGAIAFEQADLRIPELHDVAITVFMPAREGDATLWTIAHVIRGETTYADRFHKQELVQRAIAWFRAIGFEQLDEARRPRWPRDLWIRPTWFQETAAVASDKERARMEHLRKIEAEYAERRKAKDPIERQKRLQVHWQMERDLVTAENAAIRLERQAAELAERFPVDTAGIDRLKAEAEANRVKAAELRQKVKAVGGLTAPVVLKPQPTPPRPPAGSEVPGLQFIPGKGFFTGTGE